MNNAGSLINPQPAIIKTGKKKADRVQAKSEKRRQVIDGRQTDRKPEHMGYKHTLTKTGSRGRV